MKKLILILFCLVLTGCNFDANDDNKTFTLQEIGNRTYLLDQRSGDISVVGDGKVIKLPEFNLKPNDLLHIDDTIYDLLNFDFKAKSIDGNLFYIMTVGPSLKVTSKSDGTKDYKPKDFSWFLPAREKFKDDGINIKFLDKDGFCVLTHLVKISDPFTRFVNDNDTISKVTYESSVVVNPVLMSQVTNLSYNYIMESAVKEQEEQTIKQAAKLNNQKPGGKS